MLTLLEDGYRVKHGIQNHKAAKYRCDCGTEVVRIVSYVNRGKVTSCGCKRGINRRGGGATYEKHRMVGTREYRSWQGMMQRCNDPNSSSYSNYGGRGIRVCERWHDFRNFYADMGDRPEGMTLDRFPDKDGNYELDNCRWATVSEQNSNQRPRTRKGKGI